MQGSRQAKTTDAEERFLRNQGLLGKALTFLRITGRLVDDRLEVADAREGMVVVREQATTHSLIFFDGERSAINPGAKAYQIHSPATDVADVNVIAADINGRPTSQLQNILCYNFYDRREGTQAVPLVSGDLTFYPLRRLL